MMVYLYQLFCKGLKRRYIKFSKTESSPEYSLSDLISVTATFHIYRMFLPVTSSIQTRKNLTYIIICAFAKGSDLSSTCTVITGHKKSVDIVKQNNLCLDCLAHHKVAQCILSLNIIADNANTSIIPVYTVANLPQPVTTSICRPQHKTHH